MKSNRKDKAMVSIMNSRSRPVNGQASRGITGANGPVDVLRPLMRLNCRGWSLEKIEDFLHRNYPYYSSAGLKSGAVLAKSDGFIIGRFAKIPPGSIVQRVRRDQTQGTLNSPRSAVTASNPKFESVPILLGKESSKRRSRLTALKPKQECPYCGKMKLGLQQHIADKHPEVAVPKAVASADHDGEPLPAVESGPSRQEPRSIPANRRICPVCKKDFVYLKTHFRRVHAKHLLECPHCFEEQVFDRTGRRKCKNCLRVFTVGDDGKIPGTYVECRNCYDDVFAERSGRKKCGTCGKMVTVDLT